MAFLDGSTIENEAPLAQQTPLSQVLKMFYHCFKMQKGVTGVTQKSCWFKGRKNVFPKSASKALQKLFGEFHFGSLKDASRNFYLLPFLLLFHFLLFSLSLLFLPLFLPPFPFL